MSHAVRVTVLCDECVRIEYAPGGRFCDLPSLFAIHGPGGSLPPDHPARALHTTGAHAGAPPIELTTPRLRFRYTPDGRPPHAGNMRAWIDHPAPPPGVPTDAGRVLWTPGAVNIHNLGGTLSTLDGLLGPHPIGEGLLARDGWHLVDDSRRHVFVEHDRADQRWQRQWIATRASVGLERNTDWYLFAYGLDYPAALRALATVAGKVPLPRKYALGSWYSRYWPYTADEFRGIVDEYDVHGFPLDVMVLDMDWHKEGWTGWSWNKQLIPDPEALLSWMHARGLAATLNLHPADGVGPHEDRYAPFMRALGREPDGTTVPFDAGDPDYMRALFDEVLRPLEAPGGDPTKGVDFWWVDWQQDRFVRSIDGLTNLRWLNHLFFQHTARPATATDPGLRGLSFSRWAGDEPPPGAPIVGDGPWSSPLAGGWGDHRHPLHFSGDAHTGWDMLAFQVPFTVLAGNAGCFYWTHDIGGHFGPRLEEATTRWVQFGALSACLRLHSARSEHLDRRPWTYKPRFRDAMRKAFLLRSRLMPLIYTAAIDAHEHTLPLLRPMYLANPAEERAYRCPSQYMLGDTLLCAPITSPGIGERCVATRHVWFPTHIAASEFSGSELFSQRVSAWHDLHTGVRYDAGSEAVVAAEIGDVPVFVPAGYPIATQPPTLRMGTDRPTALVVQLFPGPPTNELQGIHGTSLLDDDGLSHPAFERTSRLWLAARWESRTAQPEAADELHATVLSARRRGSLNVRAIQLHIGTAASVRHTGANDAPPMHSTNAAGGTTIVTVVPDGERPELGQWFAVVPADQHALALADRARLLSAALAQPVAPADLKPALLAACRGAAPERTAQFLAIGAGVGLAAEHDQVRFIDTLSWIDPARAHARVLERLGPHDRLLAEHDLPLTPCTPMSTARVASVPIPTSPLDEPPPGLKASRLVHVAFSIGAERFDLPLTVASRLRPLTRFAAVGPFPWDWRHHMQDTAFDPERRPLDPAATYIARDDLPARWTPTSLGDKWPVDLRRSLNARGGLAYAWTTLDSPQRQGARFHFEAGDKLQAFLNGTPLHTLDHFDPHAPASPEAHAVLEKGPNTLLIKTSDGGGGWGFRITIDAEAPLTERSPV